MASAVLAGVAMDGQPERDAGAARPATERRAADLFVAGLERQARFDAEGMLEYFEAALTADPGYLPAVLALRYHFEPSLPAPVLARIESLLAVEPDPARRACMRRMLVTFVLQAPPPSAGAGSSPVTEPCQVLELLGRYGSPVADREQRLAMARRLWATYPESHLLGGVLASELGVAGRWSELNSLGEAMMDRGGTAMVRAAGYAHRAAALHAVGGHAEALAVEAAADAATLRPEAIGSRAAYLETLQGHAAATALLAPAGDTLALHAAAVHRAARAGLDSIAAAADFWTGLRYRIQCATRLLDDGDLVAADHAWVDLAAVADSLGDPAVQAAVYVRRGRTRLKLGLLDAAERDLRLAAEYARRSGRTEWLLEAEHNLMHVHEAAGRLEDARRVGERFVALAETGGLWPRRMMSYHDTGLLLGRMGDREGARRRFEAMVADVDSLASYHHWAGEYYETIGDFSQALRYYRRAAERFSADHFRTLAALARVSEAMGDVAGARRYAALHDAFPFRNFPETVPLLPGLLARSGAVAEAAAALDSARAAAGARGQLAAWARLTLDRAELALRRQSPAIAAGLADSVADAAARSGDREIELRARATAALARVHAGGGVTESALAELGRVAAEADASGAERLRAEVLAIHGEALALAGRLDAALAELWRVADLYDEMATSLELDPERAGFRAANIHISNRALAAILADSSDAGAPARFAAWSARRKGAGLWRDAGRPAAELTGLRKRLGADRAVVDYVVLDSAAAALVATADRVVLRRLPVEPDSLAAWTGRLGARVAPRLGSYVDTARSVYDYATAARLYDALLRPLEDVLSGRSRLIVVPDGPLHFVPFDALVVSPAGGPAGGDGGAPAAGMPVYAIDRFTIAVAPTLAALTDGAIGPERGRTVVAVEGPSAGLPLETAREIAAVTAALDGWSTTVLAGARATEAAVRRAAPAAGILHFAAHARPNDREPLSARLTLAPAGADDGLLHAYEIADLDLAGSLVVLSACETAAGRLAAGEGVLSLSRAFLRAGASGTVATLWPVGGATADLMGGFYRALAAGAPADEALRQSKLELRHGGYPAPFHWAPFVLVTRRG